MIRVMGLEAVEQRLLVADDIGHKNRLLDGILRDVGVEQAIVFTATKRDADTLSDRLNLAGFNAAPLHGDLDVECGRSAGRRGRHQAGHQCGKRESTVHAVSVAAPPGVS